MNSHHRFFQGAFRSVVIAVAMIGSVANPPSASAADNGNGNGNAPHVFRVVDKRGKLVGYSLTENLVAREINGNWVTFYVQPGRGIFDSRAVYFFYATSDCSGPRYLPHYSTFAEGTRVGPTLHYPLGALELDLPSVKLVAGDGTEGLCTAANNAAGVYGLATSVEVDSFGLEAPFKATQ